MKNAAIYYIKHLICKQSHAYNFYTIILLLSIQELRFLSKKN